jgi:hypothetical protein
MHLDEKTTHLRISTTHGKPFRRFGRMYGPEPALVPVKEFGPSEVSVLLREPKKRRTARRAGAVVTEILVLRVEQCVVDAAGGIRLVTDAPPPPPPPRVEPKAPLKASTAAKDDDTKPNKGSGKANK